MVIASPDRVFGHNEGWIHASTRDPFYHYHFPCVSAFPTNQDLEQSFFPLTRPVDIFITRDTFCCLCSFSIILLVCSSSMFGRLRTLIPLEFPKFQGLRLSGATLLLKSHFHCETKFLYHLEQFCQCFIIHNVCFNVSNKWMNLEMLAWCKCRYKVKYSFPNFF